MQILSVITLIIPINVFIIGDYPGASIQFPLLKYQITYMGSSTVTILHDFNYVIIGIYTNKTAESVSIWFLGVLILLSGINLIWVKSHENIKIFKTTGILIMVNGR